MTELLNRFFSANDPMLMTEIGYREPSRIRIAGASSGVGLYGPYLDLPTGHYEASIRFTPGAQCSGVAAIDVSGGFGQEVLAARTIAADQIVSDGATARIRFACDRPLNGVEIRLFPTTEFTASIEAVEIEGEIAEEALLPVEAADLPAPGIDNTIRKGRNLYEGYQRSIGLWAGDLGGRIAADPDFRYARELAGSRTILKASNLANLFLLTKFYLPRLGAGHIVEFGSYKGGSAIFLAALAERFLPGVEVIGFDTFAGMPPTDDGVDAHRAGNFADVDLPALRRYVEQSGLRNLRFVQGRFEDTATATLERCNRLVLVHIDGDIRSAVACSYDSAKPFMAPGGYWVFDDPLLPDCIGAAEAVEDLVIRRDGLNAEQLFPHYVFRHPSEAAPDPG